MFVAFPIALGFSILGADLFYLWTGEEFWARTAGWAAFFAFAMGVLAGLTGTVELLMAPGIRNRSSAWTHFILAMMLLSIMGANWMVRMGDPAGAVLPAGLILSVIGAGMTGLTGWHGGKLVFEFQIGTNPEGSSRP